MFLLCVLFAFLKEMPKHKISLPISKKYNIDIYYGDILENDGVVIPFNEYFDTIVDREIISPSSLNGKFINKFFDGNLFELDQMIDNSLSDVSFEINQNRKSGKLKKYPLGTVCKIFVRNNVFYLVALTHFNNSNKAYVSNKEYKKVIIDVIEYIKEHSQGEKVSIPLIGDGRASLTSFSKEELLSNLVFNISTTESFSVEGGLDIVLYKECGKTGEVDLDLFKKRNNFNN
jgi:hypothetical protein